MKKGRRERSSDDMRKEYDFSGGVRGKYARRYAEGSNVVVLDPDVAEVFPDRESVNRTLRAVADIIGIQSKKARRAKPDPSARPRRKARG
ncbi:MAG: hypothetical protein AABZ64_02635 [Nitrospinota bacterium]